MKLLLKPKRRIAPTASIGFGVLCVCLALALAGTAPRTTAPATPGAQATPRAEGRETPGYRSTPATGLELERTPAPGLRTTPVPPATTPLR